MLQTIYWGLMILSAISLVIAGILIVKLAYKNNKLVDKKLKEDK